MEVKLEPNGKLKLELFGFDEDCKECEKARMKLIEADEIPVNWHISIFRNVDGTNHMHIDIV